MFRRWRSPFVAILLGLITFYVSVVCTPISNGMDSFASPLLFCLGIAIIQAWLMNFLPRPIGWLWLALNTIGMVLGYVAALGTLILMIKIFPLDVLQNSLHAGIALFPAIAVFAIILSLLRWSILRRQVNAPLLRAVMPIVIGIIVWAFLGSQAGMYYPEPEQIGLFLLLELASGALVGGLIDKTITVIHFNLH
jgi:hypothetical protein